MNIPPEAALYVVIGIFILTVLYFVYQDYMHPKFVRPCQMRPN